MKFLTEGYELTTAITNIFIFIVGLYGFINIKKDKLWKDFFFFVTIDSFLGVIVHGIKMSTMTNNILWIILSILFTFTVNTMFCIFIKFKLKYGLILSLLLSLLLLTQLVLGQDFIITFLLYIIMILVFSIYYIIRFNYKNKKYFLLGFLIAFIGGLFSLFKVDPPILDHNGITHLFTVVALILFYIGIKKNEN